MFRPSSGWNTASEENYLSDLNAGGKGDEISFTNMGVVAETVLAQGVSAWWSVAPRGNRPPSWHTLCQQRFSHYPHICKRDIFPPLPTYI